MKKYLKNLHNALYAEKSHEYMFLALCTTIFVYGFMYRAFDLRITFWCSLPFVLYYCFERFDKNILDISFLLISTFSLIVAIIAYTREPWLNTYWSDVKVAWIFPTVYMLGVASVGHNPKKADERILHILNALNFGMFFQAVLDHLNKYRRPMDEFEWYAFWKDDYELRTVFDFGFILMVSMTYYAFKNRKNIKYFLTVVLCSLIGIIWSLLIKGRTILALCVFCFFMSAFFDLITQGRKVSAKTKKKAIVLTGFLILLAIVFRCLYNANIYGIKTAYHNSFLSRDGGVFHNVRIRAAKDGLMQAIEHPEGGWYGSNAIPNGGTHNTWLEFARFYNTFVFIILMMHVFITIKNMFKVLLGRKYGNIARFYLCNVFFSLFFYMTIEPVGANPSYYYVIFFIFVSGILNKLIWIQS